VRRVGPFALLLVLAGVIAAGCSYFTDEAGPYRPPVYYGAPETAQGAGPVDPGKHLYQRDCSYCHGDDGKGTARGPDLTQGTSGAALVDFVLRTGRMPVEEPVDQMRPRKPVYDEGQIAAIVSYVESTFHPPGPGIPEVHVSEGKLSEGQEVYLEHCASCHATTGIGGAMLIQSGKDVPGKQRGIVIPDFAHSDTQALAEAVRTGPGTMPVFGERAINEEQLNSLVRYLVYLKDPADPGGAPIGRVGPVVEGAVGWVVGLGLLLLVIRWIGTKAGATE
jgi:ubiquinol-cytochrome c reductase cytochrome c subunit